MDSEQAPAGQVAQRVPDADEVAEVIAYVPPLAAFFHRARVDMPPAMQTAFDKHRLGTRHGAVLIQLFTGRPLSVTALAERLGSSLSSASELVGDLERAGMVRRQEDPADRRRTLVSLPDQPREEFTQFLGLRAAPLLEALGQLSPEHREGFITGLRLWVAETER
ncbi:MarR family winged helix-turn-helix transcriptional regulator [Amycolatopsis sp. H20-H5]|uniref:MarR family winged helix-turn-helix transcriptional regulator n=1 Tax=Amycolatopsis sp. H20-H5 TaxID=3046309 RepID=UPI002DBC67FB|nr:MarR family transcriptional regulator [Amycolatopsis sp. H20-H5]MEC3980495.1 MarR family transcriptional regulator [Amycolatopsis sp. H20-H5]